MQSVDEVKSKLDKLQGGVAPNNAQLVELQTQTRILEEEKQLLQSKLAKKDSEIQDFEDLVARIRRQHEVLQYICFFVSAVSS